MTQRRINALKSMVEDVLRDNTETRNSDILLTIEIWRRFYGRYIGGVSHIPDTHTIRLDDLFNLPREDNVKRIRAHFQNDKKLYLPTSWIVAKKRGVEENDWRALMGSPPVDKNYQAQP